MKLIDGASLELSTLLSKKKKISIYAIFRCLGYFFAESLKIRSFFKYILLCFFHNFIYISCLTYVNRFIDIFPPFQPWRSFVQKKQIDVMKQFQFYFFYHKLFCAAVHGYHELSRCVCECLRKERDSIIRPARLRQRSHFLRDQ